MTNSLTRVSDDGQYLVHADLHEGVTLDTLSRSRQVSLCRVCNLPVVLMGDPPAWWHENVREKWGEAPHLIHPAQPWED